MPTADFTRADVAHLLRRAGFGGTTAEIDALDAEASWAAAVDRVLDTSANPADTIPAAVDDEGGKYDPAWVASVQYWMDRMASTPTPLVEKMTLFWHGHLTSSVDGPLPRLVFRQIKTWRSLALGDIHDLMQAMAIDPAMLAYLDNDKNIAGKPNENFARELMELFTMGNGTFTEAEVVDWPGHGPATAPPTTRAGTSSRRAGTTMGPRRFSASPATGTGPRRSPRSCGDPSNGSAPGS